MADIEIRAHEGAGVEILGIDVANMSDNTFETVRNAYADHGLVFFRDQSLSEERHIELARRFGEINVNRFFTPNPRHPEIAMVVKEPDQKTNIGGGWHTDHSYDVEPAMGSILVARELPRDGGDTWFVSMYNALDNLSEGLIRTLRTLNAVHSAKHVFGSQSDHPRSAQGRLGNSEAADVLPDPVHPMIIRHPLSGREALYVNPGFTLRIDGWTAEESAPLLNHLYERAVTEDAICKFQWRPGSVAFWDNRATWHFAQNNYDGERREMHRITLEGCALTAA